MSLVTETDQMKTRVAVAFPPINRRKLQSRRKSSRGRPGYHAAIRPWSQRAQIFRHIAELLQHNRVRKLCTLECDRPALAGSRDIPSARLIAAASPRHSCASPGAVPSSVRINRGQRSSLRPWAPPQQSAHRQCVFFSLISFDVGAFLTLPRAKPDDTAVERRSIPRAPVIGMPIVSCTTRIGGATKSRVIADTQSKVVMNALAKQPFADFTAEQRRRYS